MRKRLFARRAQASRREIDPGARRREINGLVACYQESGHPEDLQEVLRVTRAAIATTPEDNPDYGWYIFVLGGSLQFLFIWTMDASVMVEGIEALRTAVATLPETDP